MDPLISIIIPVYNSKLYLKKCVDSVIAQTYKNLELILVDDGSTDESGIICDEYKKQDSRIKVFHKKNGGASSARNLGLDKAGGEYIGFVDSDDFIEPDMYETLLRNSERYSAQLSICGMKEIYDSIIKRASNSSETYAISTAKAVELALKGEVVTVSPVNKLYRKELLDDIRYPEGKILEDAYIILDVLRKCKTIAITTEEKYYYCHREGSVSTEQFSIKNLDAIGAYEKNYAIVSKYYPELIDLAEMRLCWAHFYVLDRVVLDASNEYSEIIKKVKEYIVSHSAFIIKNKNINIKRKLATILLMIDWRLYRACVILQNRIRGL